jgi:hypothetical protein
MRKLVVTECVTIDGVIEDPGGGKRLVPDGLDRRTLTPVETKPLMSGIVVLYYRPARAEAA